MESQEWIEQTTEAFRQRLWLAIERYWAAGIDPFEALGSPQALGERAAAVVFSDEPHPPDNLSKKD